MFPSTVGIIFFCRVAHFSKYEKYHCLEAKEHAVAEIFTDV